MKIPLGLRYAKIPHGYRHSYSRHHAGFGVYFPYPMNLMARNWRKFFYHVVFVYCKNMTRLGLRRPLVEYAVIKRDFIVDIVAYIGSLGGLIK